MTDKIQKSSRKRKMIAYLGVAFLLVLGAVFSIGIQPALADSPAQVGTATMTPTGTATTAGGVGAGTGTTVSGTSTVVPSLAAPAGGVGTSTSLVPVTGADLTENSQQDETAKIMLRVVAGVLGLLLVVFGIRASLAKR